ncbi:Ras-related RAB1BV [Chlorella sorokiniana]|uniref:Ras-related RAB1BV n=1 Tax=Chlorella sorokiniana TaxID=3076 RepID=A0A2P6TT24_CHLSO|nr:Ras-related RAB1BV [Chlorella sorokiniana]|eukprot:PRW57193.1 Ras-related RAB1BV [Chlorella sorokiniana]
MQGPRPGCSEAKRSQSAGDWAALPCDCLQQILLLLTLHDRVAATSACKAWRDVGDRSALWHHVQFATHRNGSRRSELRRLLSLAAWCERHAGSTRNLTVSARVPPDCQPAALKAVAAAALAAAPSLRSLSLTTNRGFWPSFLGGLQQLRSLHLSSKEGGLSLTHDLMPLRHLTSLVLEARQAVSFSDTVRLPPSIVSVELSCIRDWLPQPLSQLAGLQRLHVRRGLVSEGVLLTEYEALQHLTALTSLSLERQEEEAWLLPPEMLLLSRLRSLSFAGNDCSRWALHGSDEAFDGCLARMPHLTSLDISGCCMEELMPALLRGAEQHGAAGSGSDGEEGQEGAARGGGLARGPRLLRLLAHGNQLEAGEDDDGQLRFPRSLGQLSIDVQLLAACPPCCSRRQSCDTWCLSHLL